MKPVERVDTSGGIDEKQDMGGLGWGSDGVDMGVMETRNKDVIRKRNTKRKEKVFTEEGESDLIVRMRRVALYRNGIVGGHTALQKCDKGPFMNR